MVLLADPALLGSSFAGNKRGWPLLPLLIGLGRRPFSALAYVSVRAFGPQRAPAVIACSFPPWLGLAAERPAVLWIHPVLAHRRGAGWLCWRWGCFTQNWASFALTAGLMAYGRPRHRREATCRCRCRPVGRALVRGVSGLQAPMMAAFLV